MNRLLSSSLLYLTALTFTTASGFAAPEGETSPPNVEPRVVDPGPPPADAIVLFDGKDLSQWKTQRNGGPAKWDVKDGVAIVNRHRQYLHQAGVRRLPVAHRVGDAGRGQGHGARAGATAASFCPAAMRFRCSIPITTRRISTARLARFTSNTPPLVNVCRKPGEWQAYDIIYHAPRFDDTGNVLKPGRVTVLQNGVLVQDNVDITGPTSGPAHQKYKPHPLKQPLTLQDHGNPVRYRNIWIREL